MLCVSQEDLGALNASITFGKRGSGGKDPAAVQDKDLQKFVKDVLASNETAKEYGTHAVFIVLHFPSLVRLM
jgi:hypothetical protein